MKERIETGHGITRCRECGVTIRRCRCMGPHTTTWVEPPPGHVCKPSEDFAEIKRLRARRPVVCNSCIGLHLQRMERGYRGPLKFGCPGCGHDGCGPGVRWEGGE